MSDATTRPSRAAVSVRTSVAFERVVELFGASPPSWLRPLLTLTTLVEPGSGAGRPSFELGRPTRQEDGRRVSVALAWSPERGAGAFRSFTGAFELERDGTGTVVGLAGTADGGDPAANEATLEAVLRRAVRALEEAYPAG